MGKSRWIDISQAVDADVACWPGDVPFSAQWTCHLDEGASVTLSSITTSPHNGTHADAPNHFVPGAPGIGDVPVERYIGPCRVVERLGVGPLKAAEVRRWRLMAGDRVLVRTRKRVDRRKFPKRFAHLTAESAAVLAEKGVVLFGIDTPSVDFVSSKTMDAHRVLLSGGIAILENLDLTGVAKGRYELVAPPLRLPGLDASPVRALIRRVTTRG
ncbi:MAG: arylformamidase [Planctomycetota bacterium]